jgi:hypothetical protein
VSDKILDEQVVCQYKQSKIDSCGDCDIRHGTEVASLEGGLHKDIWGPGGSRAIQNRFRLVNLIIRRYFRLAPPRPSHILVQSCTLMRWIWRIYSWIYSCSQRFTCVHSCSILCSLVFHSCSLVFHSVFTRVPFCVHSCSILCSLVFHSCSLVLILVHSWSDSCGVLDQIIFILVFIRLKNFWFVSMNFWLVFTRVHEFWLVFTRAQ